MQGISLMRAVGCVVSVLLVASLAGCAAGTAPRTPLPEPIAQERLVLKAGDVVAVKFLYTPELDEEQSVRPDGYISLQMLQDVKAEGLTPAQLQEELQARYNEELKDPQIVVVVRELSEQRIYVGGEVKTPGIYPIQGRVTALQAVMEAGGFMPGRAKARNVIIVREIDGKRYARSIDLVEPLNERESEPFVLRPGDVVYVPSGAITHVADWVDENIERVIPSNVFWALRTIDELTSDDDDDDSTDFVPAGAVSTFTP
jgi:protein involved in polysaccharide export with SLBB domain